MKKGYTKSYRKEIESDIWKMPPIYHRVFYYLRQRAKYKPEIFPTPKPFGIHINPGQIITSYESISNGVKWTEWGVEKKPNKKTIKTVLDWLKYNKMVTVESNGKGTFIYVINWGTYNGAKQEKVTAESNDWRVTEKRLLETIKELNKELQKKEKKKNSEFNPKNYRPNFITEEQWDSLLETRKLKKILNSKAALTPFVNQLQEAVKKGFTVQECLEEFATSKWTRFKAEWMRKKEAQEEQAQVGNLTYRQKQMMSSSQMLAEMKMKREKDAITQT